MIQLSKFENIYSFAIALCAFVQILLPKMVPLAIIVLVLVFSYGAIKGHLKCKLSIIPIMFIAFYLAYIVGMIFTMDAALARMYLENKLSFLIFPVLFSFVPTFSLSLRIPAIGYILGLLVTIIFGLINMGSCLLSENSFTTCVLLFSEIHHPTYLSAHIFFGIALTIYGYGQEWKGFNLKTISIFGLFGVISIFLTFSLSGILFTFIIASGAIWSWIKKKYGLKITLALSSFLLMTIVLSISLSTPLKNDFKYSAQSVSTYLQSPEDFLKKANRYLIGNEVRLIMWTTTGLLIAEHPFGVGTGNVDYYLTKKLKSYGLDDLATHEYNPHNQFLQTFLEIGIGGFLILLLIGIFTVRVALESKNYLLLVLILSLLFNSLFESMLQRQSGIVFYTFWICLIVVFIYQQKWIGERHGATKKSINKVIK